MKLSVMKCWQVADRYHECIIILKNDHFNRPFSVFMPELLQNVVNSTKINTLRISVLNFRFRWGSLCKLNISWEIFHMFRNPLSISNLNILCNPLSKASVLAFGTQVRGFKPGRSRRIFQGEKILSTPSYGREVKPFVPCRILATCKRIRKCVRGSRSFRFKLPAIYLLSSSSFHY